MSATRLAAALAAAVIAAGGTAHAHHGWSGYDSNTALTLTGVVQESGYEHPHGFVSLVVPGRTWRVVLAPPSRMENRGLARAMLAPGTRATVVACPSRTDPTEACAERITVDGKTIELR
jgi:hypothetical protein